MAGEQASLFKTQPLHGGHGLDGVHVLVWLCQLLLTYLADLIDTSEHCPHSFGQQ
jgi:hypothetical protein